MIQERSLTIPGGGLTGAAAGEPERGAAKEQSPEEGSQLSAAPLGGPGIPVASENHRWESTRHRCAGGPDSAERLLTLHFKRERLRTAIFAGLLERNTAHRTEEPMAGVIFRSKGSGAHSSPTTRRARTGRNGSGTATRRVS